jgi:hypothetical protein
VLQELAAETGAAVWAIASMLFFLAAWVAVVVWIARKRPEEMDARARLPLEGDGERTQESGVGSQESGGIRIEDSGQRDSPDSRIPTPES